MAITHVQDAHKGTTAASVALHLTSVTGAGNSLFGAFCLPASVSVVSVNDSISGRWIQSSYASSTNGNVELWYSRGIQGGDASVTAVFSSAAASVDASISEFAGVWYRDPLDQWTQTSGTSASVTPVTVTPRESGELVFVVAKSAASVGLPTGGFTNLTVDGQSNVAAYSILSGSVASAMSFASSGASAYCAVEAAFLPANGDTGVNPQLQFPEMLVEIASGTNYLAPIEGTAIWSNISSYVENMGLGPIGRQHELDRVQASSGQFTVNNRGGQFNSWNTQSYLYALGCLDPMSPVKVTASWMGVTSPIYYGYIQSVTPNISDVLNVDATIETYDILQMLSLKYLSNDNYAQMVVADGGTNLYAFYRLGDQMGTFTVKDSATNNRTGSLISGGFGAPAYGATGPYLYDSSTALDLTNGTNMLNGGVQMIDNTTEPPTAWSGISFTPVWTFETWYKWTSTASLAPGESVQFVGGVDSSSSSPNVIFVPGSNVDFLAVGDLVTGDLIPYGTTIVGLWDHKGASYVYLSQNTTGTQTGIVFTAVGGGAGSTIFSGNMTSANAPNQLDFRFGIYNSAGSGASVTSVYNSLTSGFVDAGQYTPTTFTKNQLTLDGNWHHLVVGYAASVATFYIDGQLDSVWPTVKSYAHPDQLTFGCDPDGSNGFVGSMKDIAIYSASLSAQQVASHYSTGVWFQQQEYGASVGGAAAGRFNKVMATAGLPPSSMLSVPYQFRTLMYEETNPVTTTSALNYMQTLTETEPGLVFQGPDGYIYAYSRQYQYLNSTSASTQAIISDANNSGYFFDGTGLMIAADDLDTWNDLQVQSGRTGSQLQEWGPAQSGALASSASISGSRTLQGLTSLQMELDSDALAIAQNYAAWYGIPIDRVTQVVLNSVGNLGANLVLMLSLGLMDRLTIQYNGQTPGTPFSQDSLVEQISHAVDMSNPTWVTTFAMSPYEILLNPFLFANGQNQMSGAASVTGSGTSWIQHKTGTALASGTVTYTVASGATTSVPYNATATQVQSALAALVPGTTASGGPINTANLTITFGSSQSHLGALFQSGNQLTL